MKRKKSREPAGRHGDPGGFDMMAAILRGVLSLSVMFIQVILSLFPASPLMAAPLKSDIWGFRIDLPEGYAFTGGDGKNRFSFSSPAGGTFDMVVYPGGTHASVDALARDVQKRLGARGDISGFVYRNKDAALLRMTFSADSGRSRKQYTGWGLCIELEAPESRGESGGLSTGRPGGEKADPAKPLLLALAYGPEAGAADDLQLSALDSIAPAGTDRRAPGPVTEFTYPPGKRIPVTLAGKVTGAFVREHDAEAAQALVDREFRVLKAYIDSPLRDEAWIRFYRTIYRDSFDRLTETAFALERNWVEGGELPDTEEGRSLEFAARVLEWVQGFTYERDFMGSDFVNLVSAATEGRGDCDSRALLWAILLEQANIPGAIMVSREYRHAMGLADISGPGARFTAGGKQWLVAETTAAVRIGLIGKDSADPAKWLGVIFE
ncbi:MAG: hypothetical protein LBD78_03390 [Spirochaetaceae bacterium]|jgi:hypothetical protein|nr:hypothetical protein [Spirochaetaceae bacterium]